MLALEPDRMLRGLTELMTKQNASAGLQSLKLKHLDTSSPGSLAPLSAHV